MKPLLSCLLCVVAFAASAVAGDREIHRFLYRPDPAVDPDAEGVIELETFGDEQEFEAEIESIDISGVETYSLWMEDRAGSGTLVELGDFEPDVEEPDILEFERDNTDLPGLPFGVETLAQLRDRRLEVRDSLGRAILIGAVPDIRRSSRKGGARLRTEIHNPLLLPEIAPFLEAKGRIGVDEEDQELEIETRFLDVGGSAFTVWVEDENETLVNVGVLTPEEGRTDRGHAEWGPSNGGLPVGAATLADLAGRGVEIRSAQDSVVLEGQIPDIEQHADVSFSARLRSTSIGEAARSRGKLKVKLKSKKGVFRLDIQALALTNEQTVSLWIQNPETGSLEEVDTRSWEGNRRRKSRWSWRTDRAERLPFGITNPTELRGRPVEVRNEAGETILRGSL